MLASSTRRRFATSSCIWLFALSFNPSGRSGYTLWLPDPDDRHVLAAAIAARAQRIVTFNGSDFPEETLARYGVRAQHPDDFASELLDEATEAFLLAVRTHRAALRTPPKSADQYLATLAGCGIHKTAARLAAHYASI